MMSGCFGRVLFGQYSSHPLVDEANQPDRERDELVSRPTAKLDGDNPAFTFNGRQIANEYNAPILLKTHSPTPRSNTEQLGSETGPTDSRKLNLRQAVLFLPSVSFERRNTREVAA